MNTQGLSADEIALMEGELDEGGNPKMDDAEIAAANAAKDDADDDEAPAPAAATPAAAPAPKPEDDGGDPDEEAPPAAAPAAPAAAPAAPAEPAPAAPAAAPAVAESPAAEPSLPTYRVEDTSDFGKQRTDLRKQEAEIMNKWGAGDLTDEERDQQLGPIRDKMDDLLIRQTRAQTQQDLNEQHAANEWNRAQATAFKAFQTEGIDYRAKPALLAAFNTNLKALGSDPANEDKDAAWFLNEAHRRTKDDLGIAPKPAPTPPAPPAQAPAAAPASRGVDKSKLPPTLSRVPPAADATVGGDEFAHLAGLSGADLEKAVTRMTPEQQERWLES